MAKALRTIDITIDDPAKRLALVSTMASTIVDITRINGHCMPQDLNLRGFTPEMVVQYWDIAQAMAAVELKLMSRN